MNKKVILFGLIGLITLMIRQSTMAGDLVPTDAAVQDDADASRCAICLDPSPANSITFNQFATQRSLKLVPECACKALYCSKCVATMAIRNAQSCPTCRAAAPRRQTRYEIQAARGLFTIDEQPPLINAARSGNLLQLNRLLQSGEDPNQINYQGRQSQV